MMKCPYCLNGFRRDVVVSIDIEDNEITSDEECITCNGRGVISNEAYRRWKLECRV